MQMDGINGYMPMGQPYFDPNKGDTADGTNPATGDQVRQDTIIFPSSDLQSSYFWAIGALVA